MFLRKHVDEEIDLYHSIVKWESRGDPMAIAIMREMDRHSAAGVPESGTLTAVAVQAGWFEHDRTEDWP